MPKICAEQRSGGLIALNTTISFTTLNLLGWHDFFEKQINETNAHLSIGRVAARNRNVYHLLTPEGIKEGTLSGKFQFENDSSAFPVAGDWVLFEQKGDLAVICDCLVRRSKFSRKEAGQVTTEQILAANVDKVFIVTGLDQNFNLSRIMRYRTVAIDGGAIPVIVLNKLDLCDDLEEKLMAIRQVLPEDVILPVSSYTQEGLDALSAEITEGLTVAFFGSSGVGKSSLTNALLNQNYMHTSQVSSANGKGRHTTTTAELLLLEGKGILIDTPGLREIQIWCHEDAIDEGFSDIVTLASQCRFEDCKHQAEPGCAVRKALRLGELSERHYHNYLNLKKEAIFIENKQRQKDRQHNRMAKKNKPRQKHFDASWDS